MIESSILDALAEYAARPGQYDATQGLSLAAYLAYAAKRNLVNDWTAARRRSRHETTGVALEFWDRLRAPEPANDPWADERAWLGSVLPSNSVTGSKDTANAFRYLSTDPLWVDCV